MDLWLYVYGNGDFILNILTSVNFFMRNAMSFFKLAAMLSLAFFAFEATGVFPSRGYDWSRFLRLYVLMAVFVMTPYPGKITIHDVITNEDRVLNLADNKIPFGLIFPTAIASTIANRLINLYQQNFEIDSNLNYTYSGMNFGANFIAALDNANAYDGNFNYNFDQYMQNCGFPLVNKQGAMSELRNSKDIFATLAKYTSSSRFVQNVDFTEGKTNIIMSCSDALTKIINWYDNNQNQIMQNNAQMMGTPTSQYERFINSANATSSVLLGISQGASAALKQAIGMNMMMASLKNGAQSASNGTLALAAYDAEAFQEYKKSSELAGSSSARSVPILVGIAFTLLFFLYPVMVFMAIAVGSYKVIGMFFRIIVCINLIPLMYEIINYMTTFYLQKKLGTLTITGQGYTYDLSASIYSFTDNMIIASNWLAASTPILAWAIVSGAQTAVSSVFGHINDPAKNMAEQAGKELALGNQNIGNSSIDNYSSNNLSSNKFDDQFSANSGDAMMKQNTGHGVRTNIGGNNFDVQYKDQLMTGINLSQMAQHSLQNSLDNTHRESSNIGKQWQEQAQRLHNMSNDINSGQDWTKSLSASERDDIQNMSKLSTDIGVGFMRNNIQSGASDTISKDLSKAREISNRMSYSSNQHVSDAFSNSNSLINNSSYNVEQSLATSRALSDMKSNSAGVNSDFTTDWANNLRGHGVDPKSMTTEQQHVSASAYANEYLHKQYGIKDSIVSPSTNPVPNYASGKAVSSNGIQDVNNQSASNFASEQAVMNDTQAKVKSNIQDHPAQVIKNQISQASQAPQDVIGTAMDVITHPDRLNNPSTNNKNTRNTTPQIPD